MRLSGAYSPPNMPPISDPLVARLNRLEKKLLFTIAPVNTVVTSPEAGSTLTT